MAADQIAREALIVSYLTLVTTVIGFALSIYNFWKALDREHISAVLDSNWKTVVTNTGNVTVTVVGFEVWLEGRNIRHPTASLKESPYVLKPGDSHAFYPYGHNKPKKVFITLASGVEYVKEFDEVSKPIKTIVLK